MNAGFGGSVEVGGEDPSRPGNLDLWVTGDNLRKGAALNAIQMVEVMISG